MATAQKKPLRPPKPSSDVKKRIKQFSGFGASLWKNNTVVGFMLGLIAGLFIATIIAFVISRTPVPFSSKQSKPDGTPEKVVKPFADPNQPMLPNREGTIEAFEATETADGPGSDTSISPMSRIFLQTGAFRNRSDAEGMLARLALIGLEARITEGSNEQGQIFRVRLGPVDQQDLERVQEHLRTNGIEFATASAD